MKEKFKTTVYIAFVVVMAFIAVVLLIVYLYRHSSYYIWHSPSVLFKSLEKRSAPYPKGNILADRFSVNPANKEALSPMFSPLYIVKDAFTDCSFTAAFMLFTERDPDYPYRLLRKADDHAFEVVFPGLEGSIALSEADMRQHQAAIENGRSLLQIIFRGYSPPGFEILRCAYYKYQRQAGIRSKLKPVYGGGWPDRDLMALSGIHHAIRIEAAACGGEKVPPAKRCFANCWPIIVEVWQDGGKYREKSMPVERGMDDFLSDVLDVDRYFVILASNSARHAMWGPRIVPNHAYYLIEERDGNALVLGNPYQTRRPLEISWDMFKERFKTVYLVKKMGE